MPARQYIGARYVTKIYENSLDPSSTAWESGVNYEPLTLVTYNNGSYLSKKEVPGSIGDPATNPDYWAQTGFYNGQIAALTNRVDALETEALEIPKKDFIAIGNIEFTRFHESGYCVDVIKIPYTDGNGNKNVPITRGTNSPHNVLDYTDGMKVTVNGGFYDKSTNQTYGSLLVNDVVFTGDVLTDPQSNYIAINDNGDFAYFDYTTDLSTLPALGYHYAMSCFDLIIENGIEKTTSIITRFMQQLLGVDNDHNYYIINTSYFCDNTRSQQVAWILSHFPTMKDVYVLDSGGSAQTYIGKVKTTMGSDIMENGNGRLVAAALAFPYITTDSDIVRLLDMFQLPQNNDNMKKLLITTDNTTLGTGISSDNICICKFGNLVTGSMTLTVDASYDGSWVSLPALAAVLPKPEVSLWAMCMGGYSDDDGKLNIATDGLQTNTTPTVQFKTTSTGSTRYLDVNFTYVTRQNL